MDVWILLVCGWRVCFSGREEGWIGDVGDIDGLKVGVDVC